MLPDTPYSNRSPLPPSPGTQIDNTGYYSLRAGEVLRQLHPKIHHYFHERRQRFLLTHYEGELLLTAQQRVPA